MNFALFTSFTTRISFSQATEEKTLFPATIYLKETNLTTRLCHTIIDQETVDELNKNL